MKRLTATAALLLVLAACSTSGQEPDAVPTADDKGCIDVPRKTLDYLAEKASPEHDVQLLEGAAHEIPAASRKYGFRYAVSIRLDGDDRTAQFVMGTLDAGPTLGVDPYAQTYFTWGSDVTDESEIGQWARESDDIDLLRAQLGAEHCLL